MSKWTRVLLSAGVIGLPAALRAEEAAQEPQPNSVLTSLSATTLSGYIDTTAVWKIGSGNANMPGRVYDGADVQDGFNLNVVSLTLDKPLDEGVWAAGYHVQMLMGPGARKRGTGLVFGGAATEFSFNEAYINLRAPVGNGLEFHVGQFGTFNGFEAYDVYKNPNWSRSYGFYIESSAHTGVSATYKANDFITLMAGIGNAAAFNNQVDARQSIESKKSYLGMVTLTAPESFGFLNGATLSAGYTVGDHQLDATGISSTGTAAGGARWNQGNFYVGGVLPMPVSGLALGYAYDYTHGQNSEGDYANAVALYVMYQATEKLKINVRGDYAWGSNGSMVGDLNADGVVAPTDDNLDGIVDSSDASFTEGLVTNGSFGYFVGNPEANNELFALTTTLDYSLWKNVISRLELRWDTALSGGRPFGGRVAGAGSDKNAVSLAANIIYQF